MQPRLRVGALNQSAQVDGGYTIRAYLFSAFDRLYRMEAGLNDLYQQASVGGDPSFLERAAELQEALEAQGFYEAETRTNRVAADLLLDEPTNHLDAEAKGPFQAALTCFSGSVIYGLAKPHKHKKRPRAFALGLLLQ